MNRPLPIENPTLPLLGGWAHEPAHTIVLEGKMVAYRLQRSNKRRTLTLLFDKQGLRVQAPERLPLGPIVAFIREKSAWVLARIQEEENRQEAAEHAPPLWVLGQPFAIEVWHENATHPHQPPTPCLDVLRCKLWIKASVDPKVAAREAVSVLAQKEIAKRLPHYATVMRLPLPRWKMSNAETRWGSCNRETGLRFSWKLGAVFPMLMDYIIVHELAHIRYMNHSPRFWAEVEKYYPAWKVARNQLRDFEKKLADW